MIHSFTSACVPPTSALFSKLNSMVICEESWWRPLGCLGNITACNKRCSSDQDFNILQSNSFQIFFVRDLQSYITFVLRSRRHYHHRDAVVPGCYLWKKQRTLFHGLILGLPHNHNQTQTQQVFSISVMWQLSDSSYCCVSGDYGLAFGI